MNIRPNNGNKKSKKMLRAYIIYLYVYTEKLRTTVIYIHFFFSKLQSLENMRSHEF